LDRLAAEQPKILKLLRAYLTFFPNLINLLSKRGIHASVRFTETEAAKPSRKQLAQLLRGEVLKLKSLQGSPNASAEVRRLTAG